MKVDFGAKNGVPWVSLQGLGKIGKINLVKNCKKCAKTGRKFAKMNAF